MTTSSRHVYSPQVPSLTTWLKSKPLKYDVIGSEKIIETWIIIAKTMFQKLFTCWSCCLNLFSVLVILGTKKKMSMHPDKC